MNEIVNNINSTGPKNIKITKRALYGGVMKQNKTILQNSKKFQLVDEWLRVMYVTSLSNNNEFKFAYDMYRALVMSKMNTLNHRPTVTHFSSDTHVFSRCFC